MKKNNKMSKETIEVISCAIAVVTILLLLSGDMIMSKILRVNPNQDYPYEENNSSNTPSDPEVLDKPEIDSSYDVSFMTKTNLVELNSLIQEGKTLFVFSGRSTCPPCKRFVPTLKKVATQLQKQNIYYLDQSEINPDSEGVDEFIMYSETLQSKFGTTPYFMVFKDKLYVTEQIGTMETEEKLENYLNTILSEY